MPDSQAMHAQQMAALNAQNQLLRQQVASQPPPPPEQSGSGAAAGWYADPSGVFHQRYWSGEAWTEHVQRADGTPAVDPPPG